MGGFVHHNNARRTSCVYHTLSRQKESLIQGTV